MKEKKVIMIYGADMNSDGTCGLETVTRIRTAINYIQKSTDNFIIVLAAGYKSKKKSWQMLKSAMQRVMLHELGRLGFTFTGNISSDGRQSISFIIPRRQAWGTRAETKIAVAALTELYPNITEVTVVSSGYHLERIMMIWRFFPQYEVTVVECSYRHPQLFLEPIKYVKDYCMSAIHHRISKFWTKVLK